jgi:hypothetical protein
MTWSLCRFEVAKRGRAEEPGQNVKKPLKSAAFLRLSINGARERTRISTSCDTRT